MPRSIFLIDPTGALTELRERPYDSEELLQRLLADHPGVLAGESTDGEAARRWLLIRREIGVPDRLDGGGRWSLDHLFLDQDAVPTLVEVKRSSDSRIRREVVGQLLDYAANAVVYWPVDTLQSSFEARCAADGLDPEIELAPMLAGRELDAEAFWRQAKTNLQAGRVRLVFVADVIPPELRRIVEFLNVQMDPAEVLAIEVRQYLAADGLRTLVPSVVGRTAEAEQRKRVVVPGAGAQRQWDEASFFEHLLQTSGPDAVAASRALLAWAQLRAQRISWGKGRTTGSFVPVVRHQGLDHQLFAVYSTGQFEFYFEYLASKVPFRDDALRRELLERVNAVPGIAVPTDADRRRPSIPVARLADAAVRERLQQVFEWCIERIRASN